MENIKRIKKRLALLFTEEKSLIEEQEYLAKLGERKNNKKNFDNDLQLQRDEKIQKKTIK